MKTSKVTSANFNRTWPSQNGDVHYFDIQFENGDKGSYGSKSNPQTKFFVGQDANYELEATKEYQGVMQYKVKPADSGGGNFNRNGKGFATNNKGFALSYAKDITVALVGQGKVAKSNEAIIMTKAFYNEFIQILDPNEPQVKI